MQQAPVAFGRRRSRSSRPSQKAFWIPNLDASAARAKELISRRLVAYENGVELAFRQRDDELSTSCQERRMLDNHNGDPFRPSYRRSEVNACWCERTDCLRIDTSTRSADVTVIGGTATGISERRPVRLPTSRGSGAGASVNGQIVSVEGPHLLYELKIAVPIELEKVTTAWAFEGQTVLYVVVDGRVFGTVAAEGATAYNLVAILVAARLLARWRIDLPMSVSALAMSTSTIIVALNAQLLHRLRIARHETKVSY